HEDREPVAEREALEHEAAGELLAADVRDARGARALGAVELVDHAVERGGRRAAALRGGDGRQPDEGGLLAAGRGWRAWGGRGRDVNGVARHAVCSALHAARRIPP